MNVCDIFPMSLSFTQLEESFHDLVRNNSFEIRFYRPGCWCLNLTSADLFWQKGMALSELYLVIASHIELLVVAYQSGSVFCFLKKINKKTTPSCFWRHLVYPFTFDRYVLWDRVLSQPYGGIDFLLWICSSGSLSFRVRQRKKCKHQQKLSWNCSLTLTNIFRYCPHNCSLFFICCWQALQNLQCIHISLACFHFQMTSFFVLCGVRW